MKTIVLISCVKKKLPHKAKARDLYISNLFRLSLEYAISLKPDTIYILSAKYCLTTLDQEIEPYEKTLNKMSVKERKKWAQKVLFQLRDVADVKNDIFIFLAAERYRKYLLSEIVKYDLPLAHLRIGEQLQFLKKMIGKRAKKGRTAEE